MKQIVSNYTYSPTANCVTLTGVNIDADQLLLIVAPEAGRTLYNFASVTGSVVPGASTRVNLTASTAGLTASSPLVIYYDDQASATSVTGTVALDPTSLIALENVTVTIGSSVTVGGTVTANLAYAGNQLQWIKAVTSLGQTYFLERISAGIWKGGRDETDTIIISYYSPETEWRATGGLIAFGYFSGGGTDSPIPLTGVWTMPGESLTLTVSYEQPSIQQVTLQNSVTIGSCVTHGVTVANSVTIASLPTISGTVTASVTNSVTIGSLPVQLSTTTIGGTARLNVTLSSATTVGGTAPSYANLYGGSDGTNLRAILTDTAGRSVVTVSNFPDSQTISGTVTATLASTTVTVSALPSGALTTRFGSVTTANLATLTAAVTNTSRKYLLAQNISAGTVTIGIGFSPTTTQGIQLTAGAGLSFDAFCPTGAVYWLGATTGANFTILEG